MTAMEEKLRALLPELQLADTEGELEEEVVSDSADKDLIEDVEVEFDTKVVKFSVREDIKQIRKSYHRAFGKLERKDASESAVEQIVEWARRTEEYCKGRVNLLLQKVADIHRIGVDIDTRRMISALSCYSEFGGRMSGLRNAATVRREQIRGNPDPVERRVIRAKQIRADKNSAALKSIRENMLDANTQVRREMERSIKQVDAMLAILPREYKARIKNGIAALGKQVDLGALLRERDRLKLQMQVVCETAIPIKQYIARNVSDGVIDDDFDGFSAAIDSAAELCQSA